MLNEVYYSGGAPAVYAGGLHDIVNQFGPASSIGGASEHPWNGVAGGRRIGIRFGIETAAALSANPSLASPPTLNRAPGSGCDGAALVSPCFDVGSTYAASATATWKRIDGHHLRRIERACAAVRRWHGAFLLGLQQRRLHRLGVGAADAIDGERRGPGRQ